MAFLRGKGSLSGPGGKKIRSRDTSIMRCRDVFQGTVMCWSSGHVAGGCAGTTSLRYERYVLLRPCISGFRQETSVPWWLGRRREKCASTNAEPMFSCTPCCENGKHGTACLGPLVRDNCAAGRSYRTDSSQPRGLGLFARNQVGPTRHMPSCRDSGISFTV